MVQMDQQTKRFKKQSVPRGTANGVGSKMEDERKEKAQKEMNNGENLKLIINAKGKLLLYHNNLRPLSFISYTPVNTQTLARAYTQTHTQNPLSIGVVCARSKFGGKRIAMSRILNGVKDEIKGFSCNIFI